jgi:Na+/H+ antiporter NhaD/arsenite permease-like protein
MEFLIILAFILTYALIVFEHPFKINKTGPALIGGVITWTVLAYFSTDLHHINEELLIHIGDIAEILLFLMGAMAIVELIDAHEGFDFIASRIKTRNPVYLIWISGVLTFFLSAALDNLTTTIVMITLLRKLVSNPKLRLYFAGVIIIAANAGGAWSPIGDITTTMLWIGGQISAGKIVISLFIPSLVTLLLPLAYLTVKLRKTAHQPQYGKDNLKESSSPVWERNFIFLLGVGLLIAVPVFKTITHLPPFMGMLLGLGIFWIAIELIHRNKDEDFHKKFTVNYAIKKIDIPSVLFFAGILMSIAALESSGVLIAMAHHIQNAIPNDYIMNIAIGLISAVIDNVPLVAAAQGMFDMSVYPMDHSLWIFLAYCTGTGGSALIIGSAAGVAAMGMEKINFIWYLKHISLLAFLGYMGGALTFILMA